MEKIGGLWTTGVEKHPFRTATTLGGLAAMLPSEQVDGNEYDLTSTVPSVSGFGPFIPKEPRELREPITEEEAVAGGPFDFFGGVPTVAKEGGTIKRPTGGLLSILFDKEQRKQFDPLSALSPIYALKEDKYPEYYMPWRMVQGLAIGGMPNVFEGRVQGVGDGMADQVPFNVIPQTPEDIPNTPDMALLSSDEYVIPADVVSMLGNGSSTAGAQALDKFNKLMRRKAHGTNRQQREISPEKELSSLV